MRETLELHLTLQSGREVECAKFLHAELRAPQWAILASLAAELVREHENRTHSTAVVFVQADQAERVLADLGIPAPPRARPEGPAPSG